MVNKHHCQYYANLLLHAMQRHATKLLEELLEYTSKKSSIWEVSQ